MIALPFFFVYAIEDSPILSRKRLLAALAADGALFGLLYFALYELRFGIWPGFSVRIAVLLVIWSLSSYIIGRYSGPGNTGRELHALNLCWQATHCNRFCSFFDAWNYTLSGLAV